ncbi:MAG: hypothetical protein ABIG44_03220 [Planctomycetota bacterium]
MSIQFMCPSCQQPIEVDEEFSGKQAGCPYCSSVVNVPTASTYQPAPITAARPADEETPSGTPMDNLHVGDPYTPRERKARMLGNLALVCAVLVIFLFGVVMVVAVVAGFDELERVMTTQPASASATSEGDQPASRPVPLTLQEETKLQTQAFQTAIKDLQGKPWYMIMGCGAELFVVLGLALSITSLVQSRRRNWRAIVGLVICGVFVLCICTALGFQLALGDGGAF